MTGPSTSPRLVRGGIVLLDPSSGTVQRIVQLQYNPDYLTRTLQPQDIGSGAVRADALRLRGPAVETIRIEAEMDLADPLQLGDATAAEVGLHPQLAVLETMVQPASRQLQSNSTLASKGVLEIMPLEAPLAVFVWSRSRVMPVRIMDFTIVEEAFDASLNPIRARVNLGMRVLTVAELGFGHRGGTLFMAYLQQKERLAARAPAGSFAGLGIEGL